MNNLEQDSSSPDSCEQGKCGCQLQRILVKSEKRLDEAHLNGFLNIATYARNALRIIYKITGMENAAHQGNCPLEKMQRRLGVWDRNAPSCHHK